jgi:hypothetical protein
MRHFRRIVDSALFASLLLLPGVASAQSTIAGAVRDTTGAVLPGVTVEVSSPVLIEKIRAAVTDGQGRYSVVELRPGAYVVTFSLAGFRTVRREGIEVVANASVPINAELQVGAVEETITVAGATPVVDVQQAGQRQVLNRETLDALPSARQYVNAGVVMPGIKLTGPTMGGTTSTILQSYLIARGRSASENTMEVDGMDVRSPRGDNQQAVNNFAMAQEVTYQINAISADAAGGGVRITMIPREGGNTFAGDVFVSGMHHAWQSDNITPALQARGLPTPDATRHMYEITPAFGGRIIRDRLWFFGSGRLNRALLAPAGARYADGRPGYNDTRADNLSGRITWQATPRNKLTVYHDQAFRYQSHYTGRAGQDWETVPTIFPTGHNFVENVKWTSTATNRLLLEGGYSSHGYKNGLNVPQPGVLKERGTPEWYASASRTDLVLGTTTTAGGNGCCNFFRQPSHVVQSAMSYVTGSHSFKTGIQWRTGGVDVTAEENNGALQQRYRNRVPDSVSVAAQPSHTRAWVSPDIGVYAQDAWTIKRFTLNAGVRFEHWRGEIRATDMPAGRFVAARSVETFQPLPTFNDVNPRLSAVYDLFGNARTALKVSASRYVAQYGAGVHVSQFNPISTASDVRNWFDCALVPGTSTCSGSVLSTNRDDIAQDNEIGPSNIRNFGTSPARRADPDLKREFNWDYSLSVQHELAPRIALIGAWYHTRFGNLQGLRNVLVDVADYAPFQVANPLDTREMITVYNLNRAKQGQVDNVVRASEINRRTYNGFEATMQARLPKGGTLVGGWFAERTVSVTCDTNDPNPLRFCDQTGKLHQELGRVAALPFRHEFKLALSSPLPWDFKGALSVTSFPGVGGFLLGTASDPVSYLTIDWVVPADLFPGGRTQSVTVALNPPGSRYLPRFSQVDASVKRTIRAGRTQIEPGVAVFNLLNSSVVLQEIRTFGPALGQPLNTLQGRFLKLEVLFKF